MSALSSKVVWDMQTPEYPAPLCEECNAPKWVNKRFPDSMKPETAVRVGYECRRCTAKKTAALAPHEQGSEPSMVANARNSSVRNV
jgi:hypothetical protein